MLKFLFPLFLLLLMVSCDNENPEEEEEMIVVQGGESEENEDETVCTQQEVIDSVGVCNFEPAFESAVSIVIEGVNRVITTNSIPEHKVGQFPNADIAAQDETYSITTTPEFAEFLTPLKSDNGPLYQFGILLNGVELDPIAAEPWPHSELGTDDPGVNWDWNLEALNVRIGLDCNYAHVQPTGKYHCHGAPILYDLIADSDGTEMIQVGWAADGFPIFYKNAYSDANDSNSNVVEMTSSYQLKTGSRPGDGILAPCSEYNGAYSADYEYIEGLGTLDATNGRTGVVPGFDNETYYYVLTDGDSFPSIPRSLRGIPSSDFRL